MKITVIFLALGLTGCAHSLFMEPVKTAKVPTAPCGPNTCGKIPVWENL